MDMLLKRLLCRIGIPPAERALIGETNGINSIDSLVIFVVGLQTVKSSVSDLTQSKLFSFLAYLQKMRKEINGTLDDVVEIILSETWHYPWEHFVVCTYGIQPRQQGLIATKGCRPLARQKMPMSRLKRRPQSLQKNQHYPVTLFEASFGNGFNKRNSKTEAIRRLKNTNWKFCNETSSFKLKTCRNLSVGLPLQAVFGNLELYLHQIQGVEAILSSLMCPASNGFVLADEMGLGKTWQVLHVIYIGMRNNVIKKTLVVCPSQLINVWLREAMKVLELYPELSGQLALVEFSSSFDEKTRNQALRDMQASNAYLLVVCSNRLVGNKKSPLYSTIYDRQKWWDILVVDEAHKAKNPETQLFQALVSKSLSRQAFRLAMTATPVVNNLEEFRVIMNWACPHSIFRDKNSFRKEYILPIYYGRRKTASKNEIETADHKLKNLRDKCKPYILQRRVKDHLSLPPLGEFSVFLRPCDKQWENSQEIVKKLREKSRKKGDVLSRIMHLRMNACHPALACNDDDSVEYNSLYSDESNLDEVFFSPDENESRSRKNKATGRSLGDLTTHSPRLEFCRHLLKGNIKDGHKSLVFSFFRGQLDFLENILQNEKIEYHLIKGGTCQKDRWDIIESFNKYDGKCMVLLFSLSTGGEGLTITGADRVILLGPSWNPSTDSQAVGRAYRIGQKKPVEVVRIIMAGTIEEKMYELQNQKEGLIRELFSKTNKKLARLYDSWENLIGLGSRDSCETLKNLAINQSQKRPKKWKQWKDLPNVIGCLDHGSIYKTFEGAFGIFSNKSIDDSSTASQKRTLETGDAILLKRPRGNDGSNNHTFPTTSIPLKTAGDTAYSERNITERSVSSTPLEVTDHTTRIESNVAESSAVKSSGDAFSTIAYVSEDTSLQRRKKTIAQNAFKEDIDIEVSQFSNNTRAVAWSEEPEQYMKPDDDQDTSVPSEVFSKNP